MITEKDLLEAIAECQGVRNPNANTCLKLASYYTILDHMQGEPEIQGYSYDTEPNLPYTVNYIGTSEFAESIYGKDPNNIWPVIDELMSIVKISNPSVYYGVIQEIQ